MMKIATIRKIDYWVGIPLCFCLSVINKLLQAIPSKKSKPVIAPRKVIFLELSEMGSAILAYPAIKKVRDVYPGVKLYFWVFKQNQECVHILKIIPQSNVITSRSESLLLFLVDAAKGLFRIWREGIDTVIDLELFSRFTAVLSYLTGASRRVGFYRFFQEGLYRGNIQTHRVEYNPHLHISLNFMSLVYSLWSLAEGVALVKESIPNSEIVLPRMELTEQNRAKVWQELKEFNKDIDQSFKIAILSPGCSQRLPLRKWPIENYLELAKRLLDDRKILIVIIGTKDDFSDGERICREVKDSRCINLIGMTSLLKLIDLYNISRVLISHDSGPPNFASLTDIGIVVLFGPETPVLYAPLSNNKTICYANFACSPCVSAYNHRHSPCKDNKCLKAIGVDEVYQAARKYLDKDDI